MYNNKIKRGSQLICTHLSLTQVGDTREENKVGGQIMF